MSLVIYGSTKLVFKRTFKSNSSVTQCKFKDVRTADFSFCLVNCGQNLWSFCGLPCWYSMNKFGHLISTTIYKESNILYALI